MKKLNIAVIGQGRSGKNIHGRYYRCEDNLYYNVKYVVDTDEFRRNVAEEIYPGCKTFENYEELFELDDIDLVINATYSEFHYPITKELLLHGKNVLVEKPFGRSRYECDELIKIAKEQGVTLAVFQQTFLAPFYGFVYDTIKSGKLGDVKQIDIRYNGFARRWDWQTLQKKCAGSTYNTGPHPIGMGLGFLDFDKDAKVVYSKLDTALTSGDADDYAKILISAPNKPIIDIEISSMDAYSDHNIKVQGSKGTLKATPAAYEMTYICDGENPERPVVETFLKDGNGNPIYCGEDLVKHVESEKFNGTAFDIGTARLYEQLYYKITEGREMTVTPEMAADIISVIETVHAQNPLPLKY
ncbi:MAG: Gfo/Idh/MocA family oxidoreductase [Ruminococcaceae bacterium]|nr:Gfo/Idh/MocA family oxidoreductase [Oscillospiraceae bacterium]